MSKSLSENSLRDEVLKWKERYDNTYRDLNQAEKKLESERKSATENNSETAEMEKELKHLNILLGLTEVNGRGLTITVEDNKTNSSQIINANLAIVHDGDLIEIVNILKNAGAEAISINDQRIVNSTAITCDGSVVRINGEKIGVPYTIKAIGSPEGLKGALEMPNSYVDQMIKDGVKVEIKKWNNLTIPKYDGVIENEYMKDR